MERFIVQNVSNDSFAVYDYVTCRIVHMGVSREACNAWIESIMYCKKIPTTYKIFLEGRVSPKTMRYDVAVYKAADMVNPVMIIPWYYKNCPDKRNKSIMYNCSRYKLVWLN